MLLIAWSPLLSVGVQEIDEQHKQLIDMINRLYEAATTGAADPPMVGALFSDLIEYTQSHFATEERLMAQHGYSAGAEHEQEHIDLVTQVVALSRRYERGSAELVDLKLLGDLMALLRDWLTVHIMNTDKALGRELNAKGVT